MPQGLNADITEAIKKGGVKIPVWVTGKIDDPYVAEEILRDGKADYVCIGRGLISDPYWPTKVKEGRVEDICPCIYDNRCNEDANLAFIPIQCTTNPILGREKEFEAKLPRLTRKKKVLVLGGGPGGMQAAVIAAQKGHKVTLWEKSNELGGQLILATIPPEKQDLNTLTQLYESPGGEVRRESSLEQRGHTRSGQEIRTGFRHCCGRFLPCDS